MMKRVDHLEAQAITPYLWRLNPHSSGYAGLSRRVFRSTNYIVPMHQEHRPDLVSVEVYGDSSLWWIIAQYNGLINAVAEMVVGKSLVIPDFSQVDAYLKKTSTKAKTGSVVKL